MVFIVSVLTFLTASLLVASGIPARLIAQAGRLDQYLLSGGGAGAGRSGRSPGFMERVASPALAVLGRGMIRLTPEGVLSKVRAKLDMAGNPRFPGVIEYLGLRLLSPAVTIPLALYALARADLGG